MEQTECSEMSAYKIQTPGNYPEESIQILAKFLALPHAMKWGPYSLQLNKRTIGSHFDLQ